MRHRARVPPSEVRKRREFTRALTEAGIEVVRVRKPVRQETSMASREGIVGPCGKRAYSSQGEARKALNALLRVRAVQGSDKMELRAYKCDRSVCGNAWHLSSRKR